MTATPRTLEPVPWRVWRLAIVIVLGSFMATLDSSLINVGLNTITHSFHASLTSAQWLSSAYIVAFAAMLPLSAWLSRRLGTGRLWLSALAGFVLASALCAVAPSLSVLILLRILQGMTGALLIPSGQTIVGSAAGPGRMGRVLNITKIVTVLAPALGPALGGVIVSDLSWRWLFLVNVPVGVLTMVLGLRLVPRGAVERGRRVDLIGFAPIAAGLPLTLYGISTLGRAGMAGVPVALGTLIPGLAGIALFVLRCLRVTQPLLELRLFADRIFAAATGSVFFASASLLGTLVLLPLYWQLLRGQGVIGTGLLMIGIGAGTIASMPFGGALTDRFGGGLIAAGGLAISAAAILPMALLPADIGYAVPLALQSLTGFGLGLSAMPVLAVAYRAVPRERLADATSQATIIRQVGGSLSIALLVALLVRHGARTIGAFHTAFGWLTAITVLALLLAGWLAIQENRQRRVAALPAG